MYGTVKNPPDLVNGKLQEASRYNYEVVQPFGNVAPPNPGDFKVVDTYAYADPAGRRNSKTTEIWKGTINPT